MDLADKVEVATDENPNPAAATSERAALLALGETENPYAISFEELLPRQVRAVNERFQEQVGRIKLLRNRADTGGVTEVRSMADVVPLLFAHTAYKSYPEAWLFEGKWDRMAKWLETVSAYPVTRTGTPVDGLDGWLLELEKQGHYVACSSGTTGKCAMMDGSQADIEFSGRNLLHVITWAGLQPNNDRLMIGPGLVASTAKNRGTGMPMAMAMMKPGSMPLMPDVAPITIGGMTEMVLLRKKIADGTALPSEIERYEAEAAERARDTEEAVRQAADMMIANRAEKLHVTGMWGPLYQVAALVRERGYSARDFQDNTMFSSGGLKRAQVPEDYQQVIFDTLNLAPERVCYAYGMQELNTIAPRCTAGRYHVAPWVMLLLLDESGETLIEPVADGEVEGRAGFVDLSLDARWGGVISGDKIKVKWGRCACGNGGPSIDPEIARFADTADGDKITCAGTIDAYVRGAA